MVSRKKIMESPIVRNLTKDILRLSEGKDVIDCYYDVKLALDVLIIEMDKALNRRTK